MKKIISYFIDNSFLVNLISIFMVIVGLTSLLTMKRDLIPQWKSNNIAISASLPGASPEQMEEFVTSPIEDAISGFAGIKEMTSSSAQSSMNINVSVKDEFEEDQVADLYQKIESKVNGLRSNLPRDLERINIDNKKVTSFWFTSLSALNYDFYNPEHRQWLLTIKENLRKLPGIVEVRDQTSWPSITVKFNPDKLSRYLLKPADVAKIVKDNFELIPMGSLRQNGETIRLQMDKGITSPADLENIIVKGNASGSLVRLKDVAEVRYGFDKVEFKSMTNGVNAANIHMFKDLDTDTIDLKGKLETLLKDINDKAPEKVKLIITGDGPAYVERQLNVLNSNGIMGLLLVIFSLFLFLGGRSAIMTSLGIPLAYFATFTVLSSMGISIDIISVVGMILILGILVDDAIIVAEQYNQFLEAGHKPRAAAQLTVEKTIIPITGTVITTIVAFVPILMAKGGLSDFLYAIPWVVIAALIMSWLESFFILPNHLVHFVKKPAKNDGGKYFNKFKNFYKKSLQVSLKFRYLVLISMIGFMGYTIYFAKNNVPMKFNLRIGSEKIRVITALKKSDGLEETEKKMAPIWKLIEEIDTSKYSYVSGYLGWAYYQNESHDDIRYSQIDIRFNQTHPDIEGSKEYIMKLLEERLPKLKTADFDILKVDKRIEGSNDDKDPAVSVYVTGREKMDVSTIIEEVSREAQKLEHTKEVEVDPKLFVKSWEFMPNKNALQQFNISSFDLGTQISGYIQKQEVKEFRFNGQNIKVYSSIDREGDLDINELNNLEILGNYGIRIKAKRLGQWVEKKSLTKISHRNQEKTLKVDVSFNDKEVKLEEFKKEVEKSLVGLQKQNPLYRFSVENANQRAEENKSDMIRMLVYCIVMIIFVLAVVLRSVLQPLLIASAIPFGVVGVIWAFYFQGLSLEVMAMVGIIGMAGVVVNDSLIMVDTINKLRGNWFDYNRDTIVNGAASRLRAIILTSVTTLGGVFPMAYGLGGDAGFTKPLAMSMGWGLLFSTSITLIAIPCFLEIQRDMVLLIFKLRGKKPETSLSLEEEESLSVDLNFPLNDVMTEENSNEQRPIQ